MITKLRFPCVLWFQAIIITRNSASSITLIRYLLKITAIILWWLLTMFPLMVAIKSTGNILTSTTSVKSYTPIDRISSGELHLKIFISLLITIAVRIQLYWIWMEMMSLLAKMCLKYLTQVINDFNRGCSILISIGMISKEQSILDLLLSIQMLKKWVMPIVRLRKDFRI